MSENPKNDDAEKTPESADKPQPGDDFEKAWAGMMEKVKAVDEGNPANAGSGEKQQIIGLSFDDARKVLREKLKEIDAVSKPAPVIEQVVTPAVALAASPDLTPLPASAPTPDSKPVPSNRKKIEETDDGATIETEATDIEENAVLIEIFNFSKITLLPKSATLGDMLKKPLMLPKFCADEDLEWVYDGKRIIITKKNPDEAYDNRTMGKESCDFLRKLLGFFSKDTVVRPVPPRRPKPAPQPVKPETVDLSLPTGYDFSVTDAEIKEWRAQERSLEESRAGEKEQQDAEKRESPEGPSANPFTVNLSFPIGYDVGFSTPAAKNTKRKKKLHRKRTKSKSIK